MALNLEDVMKELEEQGRQTLIDLGRNADAAQKQLTSFLQSNEDDIAQAIADTDAMSLNLLRDRAAGRLTRVSLGLINKERQAMLAAFMATIRILIKLAAVA